MTRIGEPARFEVELSKERPRYQWLKDGEDIAPSKKYDMGNVGPRYHLTVNEVDSRDSGDYTFLCKGHRSTARLSVEARPELVMEDKFLEQIILKVGGYASIEVPYRASPNPRATWRLNGHVVTENRRIRIDNIYNMSSLLISKAEKEDAGEYSLTLENPFGKATLKVKVIVLGK